MGELLGDTLDHVSRHPPKIHYKFKSVSLAACPEALRTGKIWLNKPFPSTSHNQLATHSWMCSFRRSVRLRLPSFESMRCRYDGRYVMLLNDALANRSKKFEIKFFSSSQQDKQHHSLELVLGSLCLSVSRTWHPYRFRSLQNHIKHFSFKPWEYRL